MAKKKILVTGVAGFIGSNLADRLLREGHTVIGIDNLSEGIIEQVPEGVAFHKADVRSKDIAPLFKGIDVVFHLAAKGCIPDCQKDPYGTVDNNVTGTVNVFDAARAADVDRVIYAESSAIYEGSKIWPTPETEFKPQTIYAVSKAADHLIAKSYTQCFGMKLTGMRYMNVYGPRQDYRRAVPPVMSRFIIRLLYGERPPVYGDGSERRDYVHVDDVNDFHLLCIENDKVLNQAFNMGCGKNHSILELLAIIQEILGTKLEPEFVPGIPGAAPQNLADITKAKSIGGWMPKTDMREGLKGMVAYIKDQMAKGNITHSL